MLYIKSGRLVLLLLGCGIASLYITLSPLPCGPPCPASSGSVQPFPSVPKHGQLGETGLLLSFPAGSPDCILVRAARRESSSANLTDTNNASPRSSLVSVPFVHLTVFSLSTRLLSTCHPFVLRSTTAAGVTFLRILSDHS